jgi:hypothetical protein
MTRNWYSVRIGESCSIAEHATYEALLMRLMEFTARAAVAHSIDQNEWEQEELRRKGLSALRIFKNDEAVPDERNAALCQKIDRDLRARWRRLGYATPSLHNDMKPLFVELERDAGDRARDARESLLRELVEAQPQDSF